MSKKYIVEAGYLEIQGCCELKLSFFRSFVKLTWLGFKEKRLVLRVMRLFLKVMPVFFLIGTGFSEVAGFSLKWPDFFEVGGFFNLAKVF